jgi:hypothetical protein
VFRYAYQHGFSRRENLRPFRFGKSCVESLNLGRGRFLAVLQFELGGTDCLLGSNCASTGCQPISPVKLLLGPTELATPPIREAVLPCLGDFARPTQRRAADLVPRERFDSLQDARWLAGVEIGPNFLRHPVSKVQSSRGQRVWGRPDAFGQIEIFDRSGKVIDPTPSRCPGHEIKREAAAELHCMMVVCHTRPSRQGIGFLISS